nr:hypothetical protein [uncultured Mucilaginibacter sp.]
MKRKTIKANWLQTISWLDDKIVDWPSARKIYSLEGKVISSGGDTYDFFDGVVSSPDNQYAFAYKRLGTKGLLLKNGKLIREINRSYYCSESYEYPAAFVKVDDVTYLIHCPLKYNRIDFENVATGELITDVQGREPSDAFHSRFEISPGNTYLMSKGWYWHPRDFVEVFNIKDCLRNPLLLDQSVLSPDTGVEINTASFINDSQVVIGSSDEP